MSNVTKMRDVGAVLFGALTNRTQCEQEVQKFVNFITPDSYCNYIEFYQRQLVKTYELRINCEVSLIYFYVLPYVMSDNGL